MRKVILLQALLCLFHTQIVTQSVPYSTTSVRGSTVITNYYDPNAGPSTGPGLPVSPLDTRLNAPLGTPWGAQPTTVPSVSATYSPPPSSSSTSTLVPTTTTIVPTSTGLPTSIVVPNTTSIPNSSALPNPTFVNTGTLRSPSGYSSGYPSAYPSEHSTGYLPQQRNLPLMPMAPNRAEDVFLGVPGEPTYLFPGLVRFYINQWVGSDYLYNLPPYIGVVVEIIQPNDISKTISSGMIKENINEIFRASGIIPTAESLNNGPPLPFFHLNIFLTQVDDSYVFFMAGRLFEEARIGRLNFRLPGTYQAITWERQELMVISSKLLDDQLLFTAREIAESFTQRVRYFRNQILEQEEQLRLRCGPAPTIKCPPRSKIRF